MIYVNSFQIIKKNIELHAPSVNPNSCAGEKKEFSSRFRVECSSCLLFGVLHAELEAVKLEWGNSDQINQILGRYSGGFDLILGADIYILIVSSIFLLHILFSFSSNIHN